MWRGFGQVEKYPIVIVTEKFDPHADQVLVMLYDLGHVPVRINTEDILQETTFVLSHDDAGWRAWVRHGFAHEM
jgi:hypothetical protein